MNTEETFILASLKEFVKLWGSGSQATFNLACRNNQAWFQLGTRLGHPAFPHFLPTPPRTKVQGKRKKNPSKVEKDRVRAALHRAKKQEESLAAPVEDSPSTTDVTAENDVISTTSADPAGSPPPSSAPTSPPTPSRSRVSSPFTESAAASADPPSVTVTVAEEAQVSAQEVLEIVHATAVIERSPAGDCDYQEIYDLIVKENHMRNNITNISINHESTREFRSNLFTHTVSLMMTVKTAALWDSPREYIWKHLGQKDWKENSGTAIKFLRIHVK